MASIPDLVTERDRVVRVHGALAGLQQQMLELDMEQLVNGAKDDTVHHHIDAETTVTYKEHRDRLQAAEQALAKEYASDLPAVKKLQERQVAAAAEQERQIAEAEEARKALERDGEAADTSK